MKIRERSRWPGWEFFLDRLTLKRLYVALGACGVAAFVAWFFAERHWVQVWAPHFAAEALGALITVWLVGLIVSRQRRPLVALASRRIRHALATLLQILANHMMRSGSRHVETADVRTALRGWLDELEQDLPERSWLKYWAQTIEGVESSLSAVRDRYDRILDERLLASLDEFALSAPLIASELRWIVSLDNAVATDEDPPTATWKPQVLAHLEASFERIIAVAEAYEAAIGEQLEITADAWDAAQVFRQGATR